MSNQVTPELLWQQMLENKNQLGLGNGFTIPFLVGAYWKCGFISDEQLSGPECIQYLLSKILDSTVKDLALFICDNTYEKLILQYLSDSDHAISIIKKKNPVIDRLHLNQPYFNDVNSPTMLVSTLWKTYGEVIANHRFSYDNDNRTWRSFSDKESQFIEGILAENKV